MDSKEAKPLFRGVLGVSEFLGATEGGSQHNHEPQSLGSARSQWIALSPASRIS